MLHNASQPDPAQPDPATRPPKILALDGSYRRGGITDQLVDAVLAAAEAAGAETERVHLIERPIAFCMNCRTCAAEPLESAPLRGTCLVDDGMAALLARVDAADGLVLAAPVNFGGVTAVTKRFMERLICYSYWPWGQPAPKLRRDLAEGKGTDRPHRPAVLLTSSAAPTLMGRLMEHPLRELKQTAAVLGCEPVGKLWHGLAAQQPEQTIPAGAQRRADTLGRKLVARVP
jgi:putative NADPH-quinone reductase